LRQNLPWRGRLRLCDQRRHDWRQQPAHSAFRMVLRSPQRAGGDRLSDVQDHRNGRQDLGVRLAVDRRQARPVSSRYLVGSSEGGSIALDDLRGPLSRIYAFDHFIHNIDRHLGNFLVRGQHTGHAVLANDYSRAWVCNGFPLPSLPMTCKTVEAQRWLTRYLGQQYIDVNQVKHTVESIARVPSATVKRIIEEHPSSWLTEDIRNNILA
jgi:hypothetical protein